MKLYNTTPTMPTSQRQGAHLIGETREGAKIFRLKMPNVINVSEQEETRLFILKYLHQYAGSASHTSYDSFDSLYYQDTHSYAILNNEKGLMAWITGTQKDASTFNISQLGSFVSGQGLFVLASLLRELESSVKTITGSKYSDSFSSTSYLKGEQVSSSVLSTFYEKLGFTGITQEAAEIKASRDTITSNLERVTKRINFFDNPNVKKVPFLPHNLADGNNHKQNKWYPSLLEDIAKEKDHA